MRIRYWSSDGCSSDLPPRPRGLRSKPFDGEGLPTAPLAIIDDGVLTGWLLDSASARQLGERPTGHASRGVSGPPGAGATNLYMEAGDLTPEELMAGIGQGLYVTELIGHGVNPVRSEEHTPELQSLMRISYAAFCLKTKNTIRITHY